MDKIETPDTYNGPVYKIDEEAHAGGQWNAVGTVIGCECEWCEAKIAQIDRREVGHDIKGV